MGDVPRRVRHSDREVREGGTLLSSYSERNRRITFHLSRPWLGGRAFDPRWESKALTAALFSQARFRQLSSKKKTSLFKSEQFQVFYVDLTSGAGRNRSSSLHTLLRKDCVGWGPTQVVRSNGPTESMCRCRWALRLAELRRLRQRGRRVPGSGGERLERSDRIRGWFSSPCG